jgi:hypothetical protein
MTEKRFKLHIEWSNIDKTDGIAELSDNGQPLLETECIEDARLLQTILNELHDENKELKKENDDLRTTITKQVEAITEMKDLLYMFADLRIFDYSSEIEEDMQELKKAYGGTLEDFLNYFKED